MTKSSLSEFELIRSIRELDQELPESLLCAIGDDCAVFDPTFTRRLAVSSDLLVENVHFKIPWTTPFQLGRKSCLVNLSDLAAMGALPYACLLSLVFPPDLGSSFFRDFVSGFLAECNRRSMPLIGGDLSRGENLIISVTVWGSFSSGEPLYRSGAQAGDQLLLIGSLGLSRLGLELLQSASPSDASQLVNSAATASGLAPTAASEAWVSAYLAPEVYCEQGVWLREHSLANAMIDVSDGLGSDLFHILEESRVSGEIELERLPLIPGFCRENQFHDIVLNGGEDYAILFTASDQQVNTLKRTYPKHFPPWTKIGRLFQGEPELFLIGPKGRMKYRPKGFDHFR